MDNIPTIVCANRPDASNSIFERVLGATLVNLENETRLNPIRFLIEKGEDFEPIVVNAMKCAAKGTIFENHIELRSLHHFPDVLIQLQNGAFGVEIKSTKQNHWTTIGNSIMETTRLETTKRIYLLFGKLCHPIEFRVRPYEECLSDVKITHSPRYQIDMNLGCGKTIFDKIGKSYDEIRCMSNPAVPFLQYYKAILKPGEMLWWLNNTQTEQGVPLQITPWHNLSFDNKNLLIVKALALFPELWSQSRKSGIRYSKVAMWLIRDYGILCSNMRDEFSAGGQISYTLNGEIYRNTPHLVKTLLSNRSRFLKILEELTDSTIEEYWGLTINLYSEKSKLDLWLDAITPYFENHENVLGLIKNGLIINSVREIPNL